MNAVATEPDHYRSEAFAEDVADLVAGVPVPELVSTPVRWVANALPVAVALLGLAFAVVPPLG